MRLPWLKKRKDALISEETNTGPTSPDPHPAGSSAIPSVPSFPDGIKVLHDCPDATIDICFVHGLTGNRESTWTAHGQSAPWPKTLLPPKLANARILTYGYDAYVAPKGVAGSNRLIDHATNLLRDLSNERADYNASSRPLIFVAHSLGGLVCKKAILDSRYNPEDYLRGIFHSTKGIAFMGTPHRGAWMADWAKIPVFALGFFKSTNRTLLDVLQRDNQLLESLQNDFLRMIRGLERDGRSLEVTCFFEELPLALGKVVSKESATFEGHDPITIHANHRDMVRFASMEDTGFKRLLGELVRWQSQTVPSPPVEALKLSPVILDCLKSLAFPQMQDRSHNIENALEGTCEWLLQHDTYTNWTAGDRSLLWIKGKPGSGKSTLLKYALENHEGRDHALVLSFFFHNRGHELQKTPLGLFRSLVHQVLGQAPSALSNLVDAFEKKCKEIGEPGDKWQWHHEELHRFFKSSLPEILKARPVIVFVDALDECGQKNALGLIDQFKSLLKNLPTKFRICFSCRHYPILSLDEALEICLEDENQEDISTFLSNRLAPSRALTSSKVPALIKDRASGIFMWARLVVNHVLDLERGGAGELKIEAAILKIPEDLDNLYQDLLRSMEPTSLKLIQWICFATRPLSMDELRWAMIVDAECPYTTLQACQGAEDYVSGNDRMKRRIQTLSCGLAEVIPSVQSTGPGTAKWESGSVTSVDTESTSSEDLECVQFIHQSVKDFFMDKGLSALGGSPTNHTVGKAHLRLSQICIRYLAMEEISQSTGYGHRDFPFLLYAATSWVAHTKQCDREDPQEELLKVFAWPSNTLVELWVRVFRALDLSSHDCPREGTSLVHIAARYGMLRPLSGILNKADQTPQSIDVRDAFGQTPLLLAAEYGRQDIVQLLVERGAEIETKDKNFRTPLSCAAGNGYKDIVQLLVEKGAEIETKDYNGRTPLWQAARYGHKDIVQLLVEKGAEIETKDKYGRTPLWQAAQNRYKDIVQLLVEKGAEIETKDNDGRTPLSWAALYGYKDIVQLLVEKGAEIETKDNNGRTPLWQAARWGHKDISPAAGREGRRDLDQR